MRLYRTREFTIQVKNCHERVKKITLHQSGAGFFSLPYETLYHTPQYLRPKLLWISATRAKIEHRS